MIVGLEPFASALVSIWSRPARLHPRQQAGSSPLWIAALATWEEPMRYTPFATLFGYLVLTVSALAQATTTPPGTAPGTTTAPGAGTAASGGGIANWWWIILVLVLVAAVIWYLMRGRSGRV